MGKTATRQMDDGGPPYRLGVGLIIINDQNLTLCCERLDTPDHWQWPQGGLDEGEDALSTAYRELDEEVGLKRDDVAFIGQLPCETRYDFPDYVFARREAEARPMKYRGQIHQWFVFRMAAPDSAITLDKHHEIEFVAWKWAPARTAIDSIVDFKRPAYEEAARCLEALLNQAV